MCYYCEKYNPLALPHRSINCRDMNNKYSAHCNTMDGRFYQYCSRYCKDTLHCIQQNNSLDSPWARCLCGKNTNENHYKPPKK